MDTKKNIQANRSLRRIIFVLVLLILLIAFIYLLPDKKSGELSVCSLEGEQADLVFDIIWYKSLIGPIRLEGKISLDGQEYESVEMGKDKWTYRISKKIKGDIDTPLFAL